MTYCFVFNAEPDGIGVVADTRLSYFDLSNGIQPLPGQALKIYSLMDRAFVAIAGRTDHVAMLLEGIQTRLQTSDDSKWYDMFVSHCENNFRICCEKGVFSKQHPPEASFIYADCRHHRGETKCRAVRLEFGYTDEGPAHRRKNIPSGNASSIGWTLEGRHLLDEAGMNALGELFNRSLVIEEVFDKSSQALLDATTGGKPRFGLKLDMTGERDKSFIPVLRKYSAQKFLREGYVMAIEPVTLLAGAAEMAIFYTMRELREQQLPDCAGVGEEFHSASLTLRHGFNVYNGEQLELIRPVVSSITRKSR
jgi:hypothetical protein